ncbi:MAG: hypothetical protein COY40_06035 [Alphaproteobacteria bacterium CG_4_10_14_0_8_um_filter_53_9]|nr:MAG: hypothetical protein COY40_06035 [Alphaproteobacteria bacterium CG_4_10_14_0_8_um_filter_53_9]
MGVSFLILALAAGYAFYMKRHAAPDIIPVVFEPLPSSVAERAKSAITDQVGTEALSTTLPIETTGVSLVGPFRMSRVMNHADDLSVDEHDAHTDHAVEVAPQEISSLLFIRNENAQLCSPEGDCPVTLLSPATEDMSQQVILHTYGVKSIATQANPTNMNPDLVITYGNGMVTRLRWNTDDEIPFYDEAGE